MQINGQSVSSPTTIAEHFNQYFSTLGSTLCSILPDRLITNSQTGPSFVFEKIQLTSIVNQLKQLKLNKAAGVDSIPCHLLRAAADTIAPSLTYIYNLSLSTGAFLNEWKTAKIVPLFKVRERSNIGNYRPISILPIVAKILEKEVHRQVYFFLTEHKLLHPSQHGFRHKRSTQFVLLNVVDQWLQSMDNGQVTAVVFLDLA